jgi:hypothetical protein
MRLVVAALTCAIVAPLAVGATAARAQVAVAVTMAEEDASQREIAGKVVSVAREKWRMLQPQLTSSQTKGCAAGATECLRKVAAEAQATHLLVVGVAPLGVRDRVVAVQLFDVNKAPPLFEESVVQSGLNEDLNDVKGLASRLVLVAGPPAYLEPPPFVPVSVEPPSSIGPWSVGGFVLVGAGTVTAAVSGISGLVLVEQKDPKNASGVLVYGIATAGALLGLGSIAFAVDAL